MMCMAEGRPIEPLPLPLSAPVKTRAVPGLWGLLQIPEAENLKRCRPITLLFGRGER